MSKVLVVEDDLPIREMYLAKLETSGFIAKAAADGMEGLEVAEAFNPDVILLDLRMPRMGGEEMLTRLRATNWGGGIRVVVLTNISKNEAPHALRFLSVDRYIVKAYYTPAQVVEVVQEVLRLR